VVGILADDGLQPPGIEEFILPFAQVQDHVGATPGLFHPFHGKVALTAGFPAHGLIGGQAGAAGDHGDLVSNNEGRVETNAELADQVGVPGLVASQGAEEFLGAGLGDGAQVGNGLFPRHADAVVGDGEGAGGLVEGNTDLESGIVTIQGSVVERLEAQLVAGVGSVGDQLPQENFLVAVERMDHQVQQLPDFSLKTQGLLAGRAGGHVFFSHVNKRMTKRWRCRWGQDGEFQAPGLVQSMAW